ncbi:bifunctional peptidase and arginyl-hydroxylase JMJD5 [Manduca sexta]|uniref:bifunctional peptidase and arginyl-hydroxylase JMJD5 n=1 Tax=Manduca sexta TaxID=7130 RepID=UPI00188FA804|nr:bifunctional peptidase and arginyl-hydroxylase JMJD5 [Manduca sexta]
MVTCPDIRSKLENFTPIVTSAMSEVSELDIGCKTLLFNYIEKRSVNPSDIISIQAVIDYMHEKINIGNWKEVRIFLRKTITIASFFKLTCYLENCSELSERVFRECFKIIDFGILFGCPIDKEPTLLQKCAEIINTLCPSLDNSLIEAPNIEQSTVRENNNSNTTPIPVIDCPSMELFYKNYILKEEPVILDNCMKHWPALSKWKDQNYFMKLAGMRTVSIEIGNKYTDSDWTQKLMTIGDFIKNHICHENGPTGYLAQYQLFDHIPELKKDIVVPEYCCFSDSEDPVDIMAWYGPKGTISPIHHDPKKNLLSQVIGEKQLFLFSPQDSEYLYPHDHQLLNNTARIDPRQPDLDIYPKYKHAKPYYCVLKPGQMLYIPPKWWHFVESLSLSFSVSFWWE